MAVMRNALKLIFFALTAILIFNKSIAKDFDDKASLSGYVLDEESKETLIGASVSIPELKIGAKTNKSGYFSIRGVSTGKYKAIATYLGYKKFEIELTFRNNETKRYDFKLKSNAVQSEEVQVSAEKEVEKREISISQVNIPVQQLKQIRIGGEADIFRSLQYLPGVLTSSQISSGLFVRGGSPDQNLVLLDGSTVYNPSHLFGFISAFNSDAIKDVEMIKGGYPAEYGSRLSAVLNLTQKDGNQKEYDGVASIGAISSRASLEGPLGNGSFFVGGRRTYFDLILKALPEDKENPYPDFGFYDLNAKVTQTLGQNDKIFASGFYSKDHLDYDGSGMTYNMKLGNQTGALRWTHTFDNNFFSIVNFSGSKYNNGFDGDQAGFKFGVENTIRDYTLKASTEWFASEDLTMTFGGEASNFRFNYQQNWTGKDTTASAGTNTSGVTNLIIKDWTYAGFCQFNYHFNDLLTGQAGFRLNYWDMSNQTTYDPRLSLRYQFQENIAFKAAFGIYHQYLRLASQQDFSFFDTWLPTDSTVKPSTANHYIFSIETTPEKGYDLNFDFYYKTLDNISEVNQYATTAKTVKDMFYSGKGKAYGAEIFLQKKMGRLTGWCGYALGWVDATFDSVNGGKTFHPKYDRRHDLKIVAQYQINGSWDVGASFMLQSGQPYTGASSRFTARFPGQSYGEPVSVPLDRYGLRLPMSHQLNLNANYNFHLFDIDELPSKLLIDIFNVYSRRDIWFRYYDNSGSVTQVKDVKLLPIIPTVSLEVKF